MRGHGGVHTLKRASQLWLMPEEVFIGLGSNLQDPIQQIQTAFEELRQIPQTDEMARSSLYCSVPIGPPNQPDYINAVAHLMTHLEPLALLDALQTIEAAHHRVRFAHWGPRTLDLDILLFGNRQIHSTRLVVPHPYMHVRSFVLKPLSEIAPNIEVPGQGGVMDLMRKIEIDDVYKLQLP